MIDYQIFEECYVYQHSKPDGTPFYVGIGTKPNYGRAYESEGRRNSIWYNIARKYPDYTISIISDKLLWKDACKEEIKLIKLYGRIDKGTGTLANLTDGGDGYLNPSKEAIHKMVAARAKQIRKPKTLTRENCNKIIELKNNNFTNREIINYFKSINIKIGTGSVTKVIRGRSKEGTKHSISKFEYKLEEKDVKEIKKLLSLGYKQATIARKYGISKNLIYTIKANINWKDVNFDDNTIVDTSNLVDRKYLTYDKIIKQIDYLNSSNKSLRKLSKELGITNSWFLKLRKKIKEDGLPLYI